ncbi:hypothetical protein AVEN_34194-1 [Araneus ventricosus]|uniref:Uncharacterized protein n=1 Tax=Araneus ventricosus TaxID=182803 RepID=A0A4Y2GGP6_ARAVE|nr:hypothetical protein AVEN_34194-1 [Araneus ventricosus]
MTRTTPELAPPFRNFRATPAGGRLAIAYDLACSRPHTRKVFSEVGFQACEPPSVSFQPEVGRGGLVIRSQFMNRRVTGSIAGSIGDQPYMWAWCTLRLMPYVKRLPIAIVWRFGEEVAISSVRCSKLGGPS